MESLKGAESSFGFAELFFSRTDMKGKIESGNSVFQRVSKFDWNEILQKPHNIIRHPAMPRGVFHLLWETILAGKQVGAYVVNRAKDGSFYWVFALVSPIQGGFVSIRLKPSSSIFAIVQQKYSELLEIEKLKSISPKESQTILLQVIQSLGFRDYQHFMTEALTLELESRQKNIKLDPILLISALREVQIRGAELQKKCQDIFTAHRSSMFVPLNLEVLAEKIGQEAAPLAVISTQYDGLTRQIKTEIQKFMAAGALVQEKVAECQFEVCNSLLQKEMYFFFKNETRPSPIQKETEMAYLEKLSQEGVEKAKNSLYQIDMEFTKFKSAYESVRNLANALEIVSVSGKIEASKLKQSSCELLALLGDLGKFKTSLKASLKQIDEIGVHLINSTHEMRLELT